MDRTLLESSTSFSPAEAAGFSAATPLTIRSLSIFKTLVFVGTGGGKILLFSLNPKPKPSDSSVDFLKSSSISNRSIDAIIVLDKIGRLLILSDGFLYLIDLFLLKPSRKIGSLKGVSAVCQRILRSENDDGPLDLFESKKLKGEEVASCFVAVAAGKL